MIPTVPAVELNTACTFVEGENVKFSDFLNQGHQDNNFGKYSSGLDISDNGAELKGWQPVWCYSQSSTNPRTDYTDKLPEGTTDHNQGYFNYVIDRINNQSSTLVLANTGDPSQIIPFTICVGDGKSDL